MSEYYHCFLGGVAGHIFYPGISGALQPQAKKEEKEEKSRS